MAPVIDERRHVDQDRLNHDFATTRARALNADRLALAADTLHIAFVVPVAA
jgi:hypothetical protein